MLFIMVFHVFPNNSDAFTSFILGDPAHIATGGQIIFRPPPPYIVHQGSSIQNKQGSVRMTLLRTHG
jgi:hypothetical protein